MMELLNIILLQLQQIHCMIACTESAILSLTQVQRFQSGSTIHNTPHQGYTKCPMWYNYTNGCECFSLQIMKLV